MDLAQNYFELFGLPISFDLDSTALSARYRELQNAAHPDRFATGSDQERLLSMQQATLINEAFEALKRPMSRAEYLLGLSGVELEDESNTVMDPMFLMEQMELRERLAEVRASSDPMGEVGEILTHLNKQVAEMSSEISGRFASGGEHDLLVIRDTLRKMQFLRRLEDETGALEADLEDELY
ncbi:Fe-S protein assembly co-chaperone HscB [Solemya pervernicosa gill symbiont]|uniref:Co-chaperone protein HscB homolog n=2 Tax=Gammaproteobacteria incertae sedis TaxID=118884 RepID=A0A1T2LAQ8_9GAMM|nr:Fe-S protein assembly co-chaperone HscB [Candidatus Reidiella endopervernicosa]OOZ42189.1 Fe-S protein assembly co-chaperone HscB [Solemya pervernicosa gill symbiont]QKQ27243.1 Fe-S protein assembly co-chaperone HscB [Candidatus Reidiella endopervernicosa]